MKMRVICFIGLVSASLLGQGIPYGQEFQINTYTDGWQEDPAIASLQGAGFVVCWVSNVQAGFDHGVYGQLFSSGGERIGGEFRVTTYTESWQGYPVVASLQDGGVVVCWVGNVQAGFDHGVYGQLFSSGGEKIGIEFRVNTYTKYYQYSPAIATLPGVGFVVCWQSYGQDGSEWGVYGQLFSSGGDKIGGEFRVNTYTDGLQDWPVIASLQDGGFVVCWESFGQDGSDCSVYCQLFSSGGERIGAEFRINTYTESWQDYPVLAPLQDGGFVVCWSSYGQDGSDYGVYGQLFSLGGERIGAEFRVNTHTKGPQIYPAIASFQGGGFVVCWNSDGQDGSECGVYGQLFSSGGERIGNEFRVNSYTDGRQGWPVIASLQGGGFVVCWVSDGQDGYGSGIFGKCYPESPLLHTLKPFGLLEPVNDSSINTIRPSLKWQKSSDQIVCYPWELHYKVFVDDNPDFSSPQIIEENQDTTLTLKKLRPGQTYFWKVLAKNIDGDSVWSSNVNGFFVSHNATDIEQETKIPEGFTLEQNYPNPFNPSTEIKYTIPSTGFVTLKIYDIQGRLIRLLYDGNQTAGLHTLRWDGKDELGQAFSSGIYVYKLSFKNAQGQTTVISRKMGLVR